MRRIDLKNAQGATTSALREINRQLVLNHVREHGPISRAEIARLTAMQRSTVSMIVDALIVEAMIEAVGKSESTGRRCPKLLRLNGDGAAAFGIDISPTRTTVAKGDISGQVLDFTEFPTDPDFEKTISRAIDCVIELTRNGTKRIEGVRVIVAGLVNPERGTIPYVPCFNRRNSM